MRLTCLGLCILFLPQALYHGKTLGGAAAEYWDEDAQGTEQGQHHSDGPDGEAIGEKPNEPIEPGTHEGGRCHDQHQGQKSRAQSIEQSLQSQHGPQLLPRHANRLEHGQLPAAGGDARKDGVEEIQHTHQPDDEAEGAPQQEEHASGALKFPGIGGLALVVKLGILVFCIVFEEGFHVGVGLLRGVEGVIHDGVGFRVPEEGLRTQDELVGAVVAVAQSGWHRHQRGHGVVYVPVLHCPFGV